MKNIWNFAGFLKDKFLRICPYGKEYLDRLVAESLREVSVISALAAVVVVLWNSFFEQGLTAYLLESLVLAVYLAAMEVPGYKMQVIENRVYRELLLYFSRVKHTYMANHHISNAVLDSAEGMSYEIQRLAGELYQVLMECDRKEKVREYILYHRTNPYLKLFLVQAYEASEKGDVLTEQGESLFSGNVEHLRLELMEELYRRKRRAYEFAGYTFVAVAPFFMMPVLKQWGLDFAPELQFFYTGTGKLIELITFAATVIIYHLISKGKEIVLFNGQPGVKLWNMEEAYDNPWIAAVVNRCERMEGNISNKIRSWLLVAGEQQTYGRLCFRMLVSMTGTLVLLLAFVIGLHGMERQNVLQSVDTIDTIAPVASEEKKAVLAGHILAVTKQCKNRADITETEIRTKLRERIRLSNSTMETGAVKEIADKIEQYRAAKTSVAEVVFCIIGSMVMGAIPMLKLRFQVQTAWAGAAYEVRQFQSVILMERRLQGITVVGLLEDMEAFAQSFRGVLRRCINSYGAGPTEALQRMKEESLSLQEGFAELADAFLSVDEVGIELAFAEVESNRNLLEKMTQLEAEITLERKKDTTDLLSKIPVVLVVGVYFIVPFFVHALQGVYEVFTLLEELQMQ